MQDNKDEYLNARRLGFCVFIACVVMCLYELVQLFSQGVSYLKEFSNLLDMTNQGVSLFTSVYTMVLTTPNNALRG